MHAPSVFFAARPVLTGQPCGLRGKMASDASVEPALDLGTQMKNFDSHGGSPLHNTGLAILIGGEPR
jgi:hypothetical protein